MTPQLIRVLVFVSSILALDAALLSYPRGMIMHNGHNLDSLPDSSLSGIENHPLQAFHRKLLFSEGSDVTEESTGEPEQTSTEQIEETVTSRDGNASLILPQSTCLCAGMPQCHCHNSRRRLLLGLDLDNSQCDICPPGKNCEVGTCQIAAPVWTTLLRSTALETTTEPKTSEEETSTEEEPSSQPTQPFSTPSTTKESK